jgi:hypothetical protein
MCTVTFIPSTKRIFLTSNRDEKHWRAAARLPEAYPGKSGNLIYPKDGDAGGTWFAVHENGNAVVFLNGGFIRHTPKPPYRKSRGLILLDLIDQESPIQGFRNILLGDIEPFTAIIWDDSHLYECRWDGHEKHETDYAADIPHIWSSVTLYDQDVIIKRRNWFNEWLEQHPHPNQEEILRFHQFTGDGDQHNDLMMNRDGKVFTVSVTSACIGDGKITVEYVDVKQSNTNIRDFPIINASVKA